MAFLELKNVCKSYGTGHEEVSVLKDINLTIEEGEFVAIVGFSGSGKTTLVNLMSGLIFPDSGEVLFKGKSVQGPGHERGVIFQNYSLLPWFSVAENIALAQVFPGATKSQQTEICKYYLSKVGLEDSFHKKASDLSQGMQQRVGIARAFALKPKILLLDEPFGMLDSLTRGELQDVLLDVWNREQITAVQITHDVDEAIFLADRIIMMTSGPKAQVGDILKIDFERPRDRKELLEHPDYYRYREYLINFLEH
ncbi:UNVERIFIED_CONTAM: hypothetical protein GTU68_009174 [Idotea baltica]|nr:hypothetical protein [Idotea baltica]